MNRRKLLQTLASTAFSSTFLSANHAYAQSPSLTRVRPGHPAWPSEARWAEFNRDVGGQLTKVQSPLAVCVESPQSAACTDVFKLLKNPYAVGDDVALTENLGWVDAWTSQPSAYAIAARNARDVAAAVNFARDHNLRLVVKGGGHSYQGTSNSADSLLVWTRKMNAVELHDGFVADGCGGNPQPQEEGKDGQSDRE